MATQYYDNEPYIVDKHLDAAFQEARQATFSGKDFIGFLPSIGKDFLFELLKRWNNQSNTFQSTKSKILDDWNCKKPLRSGFHSLANRYIAKIKGKSSPKEKLKAVQLDLPEAKVAEPEVYEPWERVEDSSLWEAWICLRSKEIHLIHRPTQTRTESNFHSKGFCLGPVTVKGETYRFKNLEEIHRSKCSEITYQILSGKL